MHTFQGCQYSSPGFEVGVEQEILDQERLLLQFALAHVPDLRVLEDRIMKSSKLLVLVGMFESKPLIECDSRAQCYRYSLI